MKNWKYLPFVFAFVLALAACTSDPCTHNPPSGEVVELRLNISTPGMRRLTRAVEEDAVTQVTVLVFEDSGSGYRYSYLVSGFSLTAAADPYDYQFLARILPTDNPLKLYILANTGSAVNSLTEGMTEAEAKEAIVMTYSAAGLDDVLPMSGTVEFPGGLEADQTATAVLLRSTARVDVVNNADDFELTSVKVYRANDLIQVIPNSVSGNSVTAASVPASSTMSVDTRTYTVDPATANGITAQIYIPESDIPDQADRRLGATAVVVGGYYNGSTTETYYRLDFIPDHESGQPQDALYGQVLRNHIYRFGIREVLAAGWPTDDDASQYPSTSIGVEVVEWDEVTMDMVFDNYHYFGVSTRLVNLPPYAGVTQVISVQTDLDDYTAYWSDADGNPDTDAGSITPGGDFDDPDGLFNVAISVDGTSITVTALQAYDSSADLPKYLTIVAGRLRLTITITQGNSLDAPTFVNVFGSLISDIGRLGDYRLGVNSPGTDAGSRTRGLVNMLIRDTNFGPSGTVRMDGIVIAGANMARTVMPLSAYQNYDVLYLTFDANPDQAYVDTILEWVDERDDRILIVQFDNSSTNSVMMAGLGFSSMVYNNSQTAFTYAGDSSPSFVRSGPFSTPAPGFSYKCADTTYGAVLPSEADGLGYIPLLLSNSTSSAGYYVMAVNPDRRIIVSGDCDIYSNDSAGSGTYYLNLNATNYTIDPANPAHVMMGNLWAWIVDVVLAGR